MDHTHRYIAISPPFSIEKSIVDRQLCNYRTHLCNTKHTERAQEKLKRHVAFILTILYTLSMLLYGAETTYRMAKRRKACNVELYFAARL